LIAELKFFANFFSDIFQMGYCKPLSSRDKWLSSAVAALLFAAISSPFAYSLTSGIAKSVLNTRLAEYSGCATTSGLVVHAVIYALIIRLIMQLTSQCKSYASKDLWIASLMGGILFLIIGSPCLYQATSSLFSGVESLQLAKVDGCPMLPGLALHTLVFFLVIRLLMR
jgi:hypothetical protein